MSVGDGVEEKRLVLSIAKPHRDEECINELRALLADAEAGKISGFAMVSMRSDQEIGWCVAGREAKCNYLRLHGLLGWLQTKMLERWERKIG